MFIWSLFLAFLIYFRLRWFTITYISDTEPRVKDLLRLSVVALNHWMIKQCMKREWLSSHVLNFRLRISQLPWLHHYTCYEQMKAGHYTLYNRLLLQLEGGGPTGVESTNYSNSCSHRAWRNDVTQTSMSLSWNLFRQNIRI